MTALDVTVVGAGIGGLTTALLLARTGAGVTLVERTDQPTAVGAGLLLQPNGLAVLRGLGIEESDLGGTAQRETAVRTADGHQLAALTVTDYGDGLDHVLAVRRSAVHTALLALVRGEDGIRCRFGATATAARSDATVELEQDGESAAIGADLVVGADGVGSRVRTDGRFDPRTQRGRSTYFRAVVPAGETLTGECWTPLGLFGGAPLDGGDQYFYGDAGAPPVARAVADRSLPALRGSWAAAMPAAGALLDRVARFDDLLINDVSTVRCASWADGRLVLLGDAAHAMQPTAGQGANSALLDAVALTAALDTLPLAEALAAYQQRRLGPVSAVQRQADRLAGLAALRGSAARGVRDVVLRAAARLPGMAARTAAGVQQEDPAALLAEARALAQRRS